MKIKLEKINYILIFSALFTLLGTLILVSEYWSCIKPIRKIFAQDVIRIEKGLKELLYMPPGGTSATLDDTEEGFTEVLSTILNHDKNSMTPIKEITRRIDFDQTFYWAKKSSIGTIFLNTTAGASTQSQVHPVNFDFVVFTWLEQERMKRLTLNAFVWLCSGAFLGLLGCIFRLGPPVNHDTQKQHLIKEKKTSVDPSKHYENLTTHLRYLDNKIFESFKLFIQLATAITGARFFLETQSNVPDKANLILKLNYTFAMIACGFIFLICNNLRAWAEYRDELSKYFIEVPGRTKALWLSGEILGCLGIVSSIILFQSINSNIWSCFTVQILLASTIAGGFPFLLSLIEKSRKRSQI